MKSGTTTCATHVFTTTHESPTNPHQGWRSYLEELDTEAEEPEGLCRRRPRGGDPTPGRLLGDLDRRHGSFHSSGRLMTRTASFFMLGSTGLLRSKGDRPQSSPAGISQEPPPRTLWYQI